MTVAAVVMSLAPIMLSYGVGADVAKRIAAPIIGGILSSAVLVLLVIPVFYYWLERSKLLMEQGGPPFNMRYPY
jgi:copper/silver efflux system protein